MTTKVQTTETAIKPNKNLEAPVKESDSERRDNQRHLNTKIDVQDSKSDSEETEEPVKEINLTQGNTSSSNIPLGQEEQSETRTESKLRL